MCAGVDAIKLTILPVLEKYDNWFLFWDSEEIDELIPIYMRDSEQDRATAYQELMDYAADMFMARYPGVLHKRQCVHSNGTEYTEYYQD